MGLLLIALAGLLIGGVISFRRQGKPLGLQVVLGVGALLLLWLATQVEPFG